MLYLPNRSHYKQPQEDEMNKKMSMTMVIMVSLGFLLMLNGCLGRGSVDIQGGPWSKTMEFVLAYVALQGTRRFTLALLGLYPRLEEFFYIPHHY